MKGEEIMQATAKAGRRIKDVPDNTDHSVHQITAYTVIGVIILIILKKSANWMVSIHLFFSSKQ